MHFLYFENGLRKETKISNQQKQILDHPFIFIIQNVASS